MKIKTRKLIRWCDSDDLKVCQSDTHHNPHFFRKHFWECGPNGAVLATKVTITWKERTLKKDAK